MIHFWPDHLRSSRDRIAFNGPSSALLEHDLRNYSDHLNDLRRQVGRPASSASTLRVVMRELENHSGHQEQQLLLFAPNG